MTRTAVARNGRGTAWTLRLAWAALASVAAVLLVRGSWGMFVLSRNVYTREQVVQGQQDVVVAAMLLLVAAVAAVVLRAPIGAAATSTIALAALAAAWLDSPDVALLSTLAWPALIVLAGVPVAHRW